MTEQRMRHTISRTIATLAVLSAGTAAFAQQCAVTDPISGKCVARSSAASSAVGAAPRQGQIEANAAPGQPYSLGGVYESSGYYECAQYDKKQERCVVRAMSAEQRESAVQTGIEVAMSGLRIQQEAMLRARQMGMYPNGAAPAQAVAGNPPPLPVARAGASAAPAAQAVQSPRQAAGAASFSDCVNARVTMAAQAGRTLSTPEQVAIAAECSK
jgi:hypothetical protein